MCGRKTLTRDMQSIIEELAIEEWEDPDNYIPSYNIAPTHVSPVLLYENKRLIRQMKWGLVPSWSKDTAIGTKMINARIETLAEKPSFQNLVTKQRCLIVADGYYEWRRENRNKIPYYIQPADGSLFLMAGLWDYWQKPGDEGLFTYTIITTEASASLKFIHHRMPATIHYKKMNCWLDVNQYSTAEAIATISEKQKEFTTYPVSNYVNTISNNSSLCVEPKQDPGTLSLF